MRRLGTWLATWMRRGAVVAVAVAVAALVGALGAWLLDGHRHAGRSLGGTSVAGQPVGGLDRVALTRAVDSAARRLESSTLTVHSGGVDVSMAAADLGLQVDVPSTVDAAMRVGRTGNPAARFVGWLRSLDKHRPAPVQLSVASDKAFAAVAAADASTGKAPIEPAIGVRDGHVVALGGAPGKGVDPRRVIGGLRAAATATASPDRMSMSLPRGTVAPRFSLADAEKVAVVVEAATERPVAVTAGTAKATVPTASLRTWARAVPGPVALKPTLDVDLAQAGLAKLLPGTGNPVVQTTFTLVDGNPVVVAGKDGTGCCGPAAVARLQTALFGPAGTGGGTVPGATAVDLPLEVVHPDISAAEAAGLGIKEVVGTFTTHHAAGQPRVVNIHLIADLARGAIIKPGATFSVNGYIGRRTAARGFVNAPVIADSVESEDIGGGVSQFATTTFNAAFFAGLDFGEYQAHTLYISRYPYGREATMGFPHPDLQIKNTTPYGVLIWTSYTATSLTITLYSTHYVDAAQTGQTKSPAGPCTRVKTERTRKYVDGTTKVDYVYATYQPREGVACFR